MSAPSTASNGAQLTIRQGRIDLSFHQVVGEVIAYVLSDPRLFISPDQHGTQAKLIPTVSVVVSSKPHPDAFAQLEHGESDVLVGWFDGSHGMYVEHFRDDVVILGDSREQPTAATPAIYSPYCIWAVPSYVPEALVPDVPSLADPAVAARFPVEEGSGKRVLQGITPGAGISRFSKEMVDAYGLAEQGWQFRSGSQDDCFGKVERCIENEEWFVVPLWHPQYLHASHRLRALGDPKGLLRPVDQARLVLRKRFLDSLSLSCKEALLSVMGRVSLRNDAVTLMDKYVHKHGLSYRNAARRWIRENQDQVDSWFVSGHADIVKRASEASSYTLPKEVIDSQSRQLAIPTKAPAAAGQYRAFSVSSSKASPIIHTSFQLPWELDVNLSCGAQAQLAYVGPVASVASTSLPTVSEADALQAVRICALNLLAQLRDAARGDLARIQLLRIEGYVATADKSGSEAVNVPRILDAASLLLKHALGPVQGSHARTALVLHVNPLNVPTMLGAVAELRW